MKVKKLREDAIVPTRASKGAAAFDLYWCPSEFAREVANNVILETGVAFEIAEGWVGLVFSRSGHGFNYGVRLANCVGVIDQDYRGEVKVKLVTDENNKRLTLRYGSRIAQIVFVPYFTCGLELVDELDETTRASGGFGSTGQ